MSSVLNLINAIEAGRTRECETAFESLIHAKIAEKMDERRAEIRANMFESVELDEQQLDEGGDSEQKLLDLAKYAKKDKDMVAHHQHMSEYYKNHADKARGTNHKGGAGSFIANSKKANEHKMKAINLKAKSGQ